MALLSKPTDCALSSPFDFRLLMMPRTVGAGSILPASIAVQIPRPTCSASSGEGTGMSSCLTMPMNASSSGVACADPDPKAIATPKIEHRLEQSTDSGRITLPARDGADTLVEALRRLGSANIELVDVVLRRPSLDDVFFALTNESATRTSDPAAAAVSHDHLDHGATAPV